MNTTIKYTFLGIIMIISHSIFNFQWNTKSQKSDTPSLYTLSDQHKKILENQINITIDYHKHEMHFCSSQEHKNFHIDIIDDLEQMKEELCR